MFTIQDTGLVAWSPPDADDAKQAIPANRMLDLVAAAERLGLASARLQTLRGRSCDVALNGLLKLASIREEILSGASTT